MRMIKMISTSATPTRTMVADSLQSVEDSEAEDLIAGGYATMVDILPRNSTMEAPENGNLVSTETADSGPEEKVVDTSAEVEGVTK